MAHLITKCLYGLAAVVVLAVGMTPLARGAAPTYTITDLGTLGGTDSNPYALSENGFVVGDSYGYGNLLTHPFLWANGVMTDLGTLGSRDATATGVNSSGVVVGVSGSYGFIYSNGTMVAITGYEPSTPFLTSVLPTAINEAGLVVGSALLGPDRSYPQGRAATWDGETIVNLGTLLDGYPPRPGAIRSYGMAMNNSGVVIGYSDSPWGNYWPFIYEDGQMKSLGLGATAINDQGDVVGMYGATSAIYSGGQISVLDFGPGILANDPRDINNHGQVVGVASHSIWDPVSGQTTWRNFPFLFDGQSMIDLTTLPEVSAVDFWPNLINDRGQMAGTGRVGNHRHAFLLTPTSALDTTPPVITPTITGTLGLNGWYTSDVTVAWDVVDGESPITTQIECGTTTLNTQTASKTFTCSATSGGGTSSNTVTIKLDKTPPTINCSVTPNVLSPPNHKLVNVGATVNVTDSLSGPSGFTLVSVTSNEAGAGLDKNDVPNDIQGWTDIADVNGQLRAERADAGTGRVYTVRYQGVDAAGNSALCNATVLVPHGQSKK